MTVFINTFKRLYKNIVMVIFIIILPLVAILPSTILTSHSVGVNLAVTDNDNTAFTNNLINRLSKNFSLVRISENEIHSSLDNSSAAYAIVIPKGFTNEIINGKSPKINGFGVKEKNYSKIIGAAIDGFVYPSKLIAAKTHGVSTAFYAAVSKIPATKSFDQPKNNKLPYGLIIQFVFMSSILASSIIISDKESKTFYRSFNAPISMKNYMLQSILCFLILSVLQIFLLFGVSCMLGSSPGSQPASMLILLFIAAVVSVALGVAVSSLCKSTVQAICVGLGIVIVMCMFGGAWGMTPTSPLLVGLAKITPYYWAKDASDKLLAGNSLRSVCSNMLILLSFAAVFFLAGTWRKSDIQR